MAHDPLDDLVGLSISQTVGEKIAAKVAAKQSEFILNHCGPPRAPRR
jgi:hypothetical protein